LYPIKPYLPFDLFFKKSINLEKWLILLLTGMMLFVCPIDGYGQRSKSRAQLMRDRSKTEKEINLTRKLLRETQAKKNRSFNDLALIRKELSLREKLIETLSEEIKQTEKDIEETSTIVCAMEEDIQEIRMNYAQTVQATYVSMGEDNFWLSVLSASSISEAYYRAVYFQQFSKYRRDQISLIEKTKSFLEQKNAELEASLVDKANLIKEKQDEKALLQKRRKEKNRIYQSFKTKERNYSSRLERQRRELKILIETIDIEYGVKTSVKNDATGQAFEKKRGSLIWPLPTTKGVVVGKFGVTTDSYGNRIRNDGIFIRTSPNQSVRAIYQGKVSGVQKVPNSGYMVIVEHGIYRSVYANLSTVKVKVGQKVKYKQTIGVVRTDGRTNETVLNFLIYKIPNTFVDPLKWIAKKK